MCSVNSSWSEAKIHTQKLQYSVELDRNMHENDSKSKFSCSTKQKIVIAAAELMVSLQW